jgi:hypothetical protein
MKKHWQITVLVVAILFVAGIALAQTWHTANQATVAWDAVLLDNGDPIPPTDTVEYVVYLSNAITDPNKDNPVEVATTTDTDQVITLNVEGSYFVGVKAVRKIADGTNVGESVVAWSDDPQYVQNGETFGLRYFLPPAAPSNLRPV